MIEPNRKYLLFSGLFHSLSYAIPVLAASLCTDTNCKIVVAALLTTSTPAIKRRHNDQSSSRVRQIMSTSQNSNRLGIDDVTNASRNNIDVLLPTMIVFDLDDCLWSPEMYTLHGAPSIPEEGDLSPPGIPDQNIRGCVGMKVPNGPTVRIFSGARQVLYELVTDPKYRGIIVASASSSEEPSFSYSCLRGIEILPGLTLDKIFKFNQIGRTGELSSDKRTHFRLLHRESHVPYEEMLFFDDCNWGDHCSTVTREFGVVSMRTPKGLLYSEFIQALDKFRKHAEKKVERH